MEDLFVRMWENLGDRVSGPMWFRLVMQPVVASIFALRAAVKDTREGNPGYFWAVMTHTEKRSDLIREGWASVSKVFIMAVIIDVIYQLIVLRWVYPVEVLLVAFLLAVVPYVLIRGPVNRFLSRFFSKKMNDNKEE